VGRKRDKTTTAAIHKLLDERKQIEQWLVRLDKAADRTPESVRVRVRGDYESRLAAVVGELQGYEDDLRASLEEVQERHGAARELEREATEELAEAELRFTVGEYGDTEWSEKKTALLDRLIRIREDIGQAEDEIAELEEVLASIAAPEEPAPAPAPVEAAEPEIAELDEIDEEPEPRAPAPPRAVDERLSLGSDLGLRDLPAPPAPPPAPKPAPTTQTEAFGNELEFLKALSDEADKRPARASGATPRPPSVPIPTPEPPKPVENLSDQQALSRSRPSVINQRTLKCGECGAMNLPTEWYCDRCGAELASL